MPEAYEVPQGVVYFALIVLGALVASATTLVRLALARLCGWWRARRVPRVRYSGPPPPMHYSCPCHVVPSYKAHRDELERDGFRFTLSPWQREIVRAGRVPPLPRKNGKTRIQEAIVLRRLARRRGKLAPALEVIPIPRDPYTLRWGKMITSGENLFS